MICPLRNSVLALALALPIASQAKADEPKKIESVGTWQETVSEASPPRQEPTTAFITDEKGLDELYKKYGLSGKKPNIDFKTEIVLFAVSQVSRIRIESTLDEKGDLKFLGVGNRDVVPGQRCFFATVKKDGVKTVYGKPIAE